MASLHVRIIAKRASNSRNVPRGMGGGGGGGGGGGEGGCMYNVKCTNVLTTPNFYQISTGVYGRVVLGPWNPQIDHEIFCFINKA